MTSQQDSNGQPDPINMLPLRINRSKLGINDPRVKRCYDRGNGFFDEDVPIPDQIQTNGTSYRTENWRDLVGEINEEVNESTVDPVWGGAMTLFLPRRRLRAIMTPERVKIIVAGLGHFSPDDLGTFVQASFRGGWHIGAYRRPSVKLLTALICCDAVDHYLDLVDQGVSDVCLPPVYDNGDHRRPLRCQGRECKISHTFLGNIGIKKIKRFYQWAYRINAPYLKNPKKGTLTYGNHHHYVFNKDDAMPIISRDVHKPGSSASRADWATGTKPSGSQGEFDGGFSTVTRVEFHPDHYDFGERNGEKYKVFALKRLNATDPTTFSDQLASLLAFIGDENEHFVKLLASFEIQDQYKANNAQYYLLFPWADGTLWDFWKFNDAIDRRTNLSQWMSDQCYRLAKALQIFHNERRSQLKFPGNDDQELYGHHGDIKSENILWFAKQSLLVLNGFSLARLNSKISQSAQDPDGIVQTKTYRAPEFDMPSGKISYASDIFSLGCAFLEFATWFIEGFHAASEEFVEARLEQDPNIPHFQSDTFFKIEERSGEKVPVIKPQVTNWIRRLRNHRNCTQFIADFLDLAESHMLDPKPKERYGADRVVKRLWELRKACRADTIYWKEPKMNIFEQDRILPSSIPPLGQALNPSNKLNKGPQNDTLDTPAVNKGPEDNIPAISSHGTGKSSLSNSNSVGWPGSSVPGGRPGTESTDPTSIDNTDDATNDQYSKAGSVVAFQDEYSKVLVNEIRQDLSSFERAWMKTQFPTLLEEFALRLGNQQDNPMFRNMMHVAHKMSKSITNQLCGDVSEDEELSLSDYDSDNDSDSDNDGLWVNPEQSSEEKVAEWHLSLHEEMDRPSSPKEEPDQSLFPPPKSFDEQLEQDQRDLRKSEAYSWLITTARRKMQMNGIDPHIMDSHRAWIWDTLRNNTPKPYKKISRRRKPNQYSVHFKLRWNLVTFMEQQQYSDAGTRGIIGRVITLTGDHHKVYATSLRDYMTAVWPSTGPDLVEFFEDLWENTSGDPQKDLKNGTTISARIEQDVTYFEATGTEFGLAEIAQQLFWMSSALQTKGLNSVAFLIAKVQNDRFIPNPALPSHPAGNEIIGTLECKVDYLESPLRRKDLSVSTGHCWHPFFRHCQIVQGYPIPERPEGKPGLEISLEMMAALACANRVAPFCNTLVVKGVSTLLYATSIGHDCIFWHLIHNSDGSPISYSDERVKVSSDSLEDMSLLQPIVAFRTRHVVGWAEELTSHAGSNTADYNIQHSCLSSPNEDIHFEKAQISVGKIIGGAGTFSRGNREKPLHNPAQGEAYFKNLERLKNHYVVLYDVQSERAWLVYAIQALLHLTQAYLRDVHPNGACPVLKIKGELPPENIDAETALELLKDHDNMRIEVGQSGEHTKRDDPSAAKEEDTYRLRDVTEDRLEKLEQMIGYVADRRSETGVGWRIRFSLAAEKLVGYDFMEIVEENIHTSPLVTKLKHGGREWGDLIKWIDAPVLFGRGFGDLLKPIQRAGENPCEDCCWNCYAPHGHEVLSVSLSLLGHLVMRRGERRGTSWWLVENFHLDMPESVFSDCQLPPRDPKHESRIRKITKKPRPKRRSHPVSVQPARGRSLAGVLIGTRHKVLRKDKPKDVATEALAPKSAEQHQQSSRSDSSLFSGNAQTWTPDSSVSNREVNNIIKPSDSQQIGPVNDYRGKGKGFDTPGDNEGVASLRPSALEGLTASLAEESPIQTTVPCRNTLVACESAGGSSSCPSSIDGLDVRHSDGAHELDAQGQSRADPVSEHDINIGPALPEIDKSADENVMGQDAGSETMQDLGRTHHAQLTSQLRHRRLVSRARKAPFGKKRQKRRVTATLVPRNDHSTGRTQTHSKDRVMMVLVVGLGSLVLVLVLLIMSTSR